MYTLEEQAEKRLQDLLVQAMQETEYYRRFFSTCKEQMKILELSDFPFLTRQIVQRERSRFLCDKYQRYPDIDYLLLKRSFGLSGIPLEIYWDRRNDVRSQAFLWAYRKERFGITTDEKCCVFRTAEYAGNKIMDIIPKYLSQDGKVVSFSMYDLSPERLQWCWGEVLAFDPAWIILPPSIALMLAENITADKQSVPLSLRYIELRGEMMDMQAETKIRDVFHVQTGRIYDTQASGVIAASCEHGHLHIFPENAVVEVIQEGRSVIDEEGVIYVTSLQNTAMPLIRLKTGDWGILQSASCTCGQQSPVLRLIQGRTCDFIATASGRRVSAFLLRSMAEYTNEEVSRCLTYIQFRQNDYDHMDAVLCTKPAFAGWGQETSRVFMEKLKDPELRKMQWNFIYENPHESKENEMDEHLFFESWKGGRQ